jgi:hypothetical protein
MPQVLDSYEFPETVAFGHSSYDWDTLLDGKIYQLKQGEDFECKMQTMALLTRKNAKKRGFKVRVSKKDDTTLVIQQVGVDENAETPETAPAAPQANGTAKPPTPAAHPTPAAPAAAKPAAPGSEAAGTRPEAAGEARGQAVIGASTRSPEPASPISGTLALCHGGI